MRTGWRGPVLGLILAGLALGAAGCATEKHDLQRSDIEQWYKDGTINHVEYEDLMQKLDAKEAAEKAKNTPAQQPPTVAPGGIGQPASPPSGQALY